MEDQSRNYFTFEDKNNIDNINHYNNKKILSTELFFKLNFDITDNGEIFHKSDPYSFLYTYMIEGVVRYVATINNIRMIFAIHKILAYKKFGKTAIDKNNIVLHKDLNLSNNNINNLIVSTRSDRMMMIPQETRQKSAEHAASFRLKFEHKKVYEFYLTNYSYYITMDKFKIKSKSTLSSIIKKYK